MHARDILIKKCALCSKKSGEYHAHTSPKIGEGFQKHVHTFTLCTSISDTARNLKLNQSKVTLMKLTFNARQREDEQYLAI